MNPRKLPERLVEFVQTSITEIGIELWPVKVFIFGIIYEPHYHHECEDPTEEPAPTRVSGFTRYEDENGERWITR